jgi:hypothetical protein
LPLAVPLSFKPFAADASHELLTPLTALAPSWNWPAVLAGPAPRCRRQWPWRPATPTG